MKGNWAQGQLITGNGISDVAVTAVIQEQNLFVMVQTSASTTTATNNQAERAVVDMIKQVDKATEA